MPETDTQDETLVSLAPPRRGERESSEYMARIDAGEADVAAMNSLSRRGVRVGNENIDADIHLHEMIPKPWGQEYRAYADDFLDVWHLQINPGHSTSMHAHPRKTTYLLCLSGSGMTRTLRGDRPSERGTGSAYRAGCLPRYRGHGRGSAADRRGRNSSQQVRPGAPAGRL